VQHGTVACIDWQKARLLEHPTRVHSKAVKRESMPQPAHTASARNTSSGLALRTLNVRLGTGTAADVRDSPLISARWSRPPPSPSPILWGRDGWGADEPLMNNVDSRRRKGPQMFMKYAGMKMEARDPLVAEWANTIRVEEIPAASAPKT